MNAVLVQTRLEITAGLNVPGRRIQLQIHDCCAPSWINLQVPHPRMGVRHKETPGNQKGPGQTVRVHEETQVSRWKRL